MKINITYKSPEHEAAFLSELQRIPHIVNVELINRLFHACLLCPPAVEPLPRIQDLRAPFFPLRVFRSSHCDGRAVRGPRAALSITSLWAVSRRLILTCWQFACSFSECFLLR